MNALVPNQPSSIATKQILSELTPGLKALLGIEPSNLRAVSEIAKSPALLAEVTAALPAIKANAVEPATQEDIQRVVKAKFATYRQPERSAGEWTLFWDDHYTVLVDVSLSALDSALEACLADPSIEFLPKPAKLREMARMTPNRAVRAYDRAKAAIEFTPEKPREPVDMGPIINAMGAKRLEPSNADKERVRHQMREYIRLDDERKAKLKTSGPDLPPCHAQTDETGVSPQMRALIQGREDQ